MKILFLALCITLTACGAHDDKPAKIAEPQREALDKAKAIDNTVQQQADEQRKKIDDAESK